MAPKLLVMTVGLPRSGKTTAVMTIAGGAGAIVSPDAIRLALHGAAYYAPAETLVWSFAKLMVAALFGAGHSVVILDATNISKKRRNEWKSPTWARRYVVLDTSKEECIRRAVADNRPDLVPVIERMAEEYEPVTEDEQP